MTEQEEKVFWDAVNETRRALDRLLGGPPPGVDRDAVPQVTRPVLGDKPPVTRTITYEHVGLRERLRRWWKASNPAPRAYYTYWDLPGGVRVHNWEPKGEWAVGHGPLKYIDAEAARAMLAGAGEP